MAWFKFGNKFGSKDGDKVRTQQAPVQSVEAMRQRAKHRLIGTVVLVLAGVVGFPMLFDSQPRPVLVDVPIDIPDKTKVKPLASPPAAGPTAAPAAGPAAAPAARVDASASLGGKEEIVPPQVLAPKIEEKLAAASASNAQEAPKIVASAATTGVAAALAAAQTKAKKDDAKPPADDAAKADAVKSDTAKADAAKAKAAEAAKEKEARAKEAKDKQAKDKETARAKALLDGNEAKLPASSSAPPAPQAGADTRYIVQFGAFSDPDKAQVVRRKVEKAGLKTYSQVTETAQGKRYRARVGPFTTRDEADKAAAKIKALDLPASVLTL